MPPYSRIGTFHLIKVAFLVTFLVVLPRIVEYLDVVDFGEAYFSGATWLDLILRVVLFFVFSLMILELNTNGPGYVSRIPKIYRTGLIYVLNVVLIFGATKVFRLVYTQLTQTDGGANGARFIGPIFFVLTLILIFISHIIRLQKTRQDKMMENAELRQQNLQKELSALKNQVNPHFLFNSLNSLSALVRDNKKAASFVKNLSFLYRYILQSGEHDLVTVREELRFLDSYLDLIKVRYGDRINEHINVEESIHGRQLPPLALQLLVENAVKHNEISEKHPLEIEVHSTENSMVVQNKIKPRKSLVQSNGVGLANLDKRYQLLTGQSIAIQQKEGQFLVELPII